eukprot:5316910-Prymnesium_polylepis.1
MWRHRVSWRHRSGFLRTSGRTMSLANAIENLQLHDGEAEQDHVAWCLDQFAAANEPVPWNLGALVCEHAPSLRNCAILSTTPLPRDL